MKGKRVVGIGFIVKKDKQKKTEQGGDIKSEEEKQQKQLPEDDRVASKLFSSVSCYKCTLFLSNDIIPAALIGDLKKKKKKRLWPRKFNQVCHSLSSRYRQRGHEE